MIVELLSANYVEIRYTPSSDVAMGEVTQLNDCFGFPLADVASGEEGSFIIKAEKVKAPKLAGVVFDSGEDLYWLSAGTDDMSNVDGGATDYLLGFSFKEYASALTECIMAFDGRAEFLKA